MEMENLSCRTSGRAAKRMEGAHRHEAKTIHRMLSFSAETGAFQYDEDTPLIVNV